MSDTQAPPAPMPTAPAAPTIDEEPVYLPDEPNAIDWTTPSPAATQAIRDLEPASAKTPSKTLKRRGLPVGPALAAIGNTTALAVTSAYQVGGWPAFAGAGATVLGGAAAVTARRRAAVRRKSATAAGRQRSGALHSASAQTATGHSGNRRTSTSNGGFWGGQRSGGSARAGRSQGSSGGRWDVRPSGARAGGAGAGMLGHATMPGALPGRGRTDARTRTSGQAGNLPGHARATGDGPGRRSDASSGHANRLTRVADRLGGGSGRTRTEDRKPKKDRTGKTKDMASRPSVRAAKRAAALAKTASLAAGRGTAKAWKATRPHRRRLASATARAAGRAWDGLRAVLAGVATGLWHRSWAAALERVKQVWGRLRKRRAERNTPVEEAVTPEPIADTVRRPANSTTTSTTTATGAAVMSGHHFVASAMEMARAASAYEPRGMMQVGRDFAGLQEALQLVAEAMKISTDKADATQPLDPRIIEMMRGIYQLQIRAAEMAAELGPAFQNFHQVDIARHETPRKGLAGEAMWDISANLG